MVCGAGEPQEQRGDLNLKSRMEMEKWKHTDLHRLIKGKERFKDDCGAPSEVSRIMMMSLIIKNKRGEVLACS